MKDCCAREVKVELEGYFKYWREGFANQGLILHPELTPEENARIVIDQIKNPEKYAEEIKEQKFRYASK